MKKELLSLGALIVAVPVAEAYTITAPATMTLGNQTLHLSQAAQARINKQVKRLTQNPEYYQIYLQRAALYFPHIEKILADNGVPPEFKFLVLQESALEPNAVSKSAAVGYWQFKKGTAEDFTLRVDAQVDERKNIVTATQAAATYFRKSQAEFNNWTYALLSYNLGIKGTETKYGHILKNKSGHVYINEKTHGYVLRFIAHCLAFQNAEVHDKSNKTLIPFSTRGFKVSQVAKHLGVKTADIKAHNQWLKSDQMPKDRDYVLLVPVSKEKRTEAIIKLSLLTGYESNPYDKKRFKGIIKTNHTAAHEVTVVTKKSIAQKVKIKTTKAKRDSVVIKGDKNKYPRVESMSVTKVGDRTILLGQVNGIKAILAHEERLLSDLAKDLKIDHKKLLAYNDLQADQALAVGTVYYLAPKGKWARVPYHTLLSGESLWTVSQIFGLNLGALRKLNGLPANASPQEGTVLWLQGKKPAHIPFNIEPDPNSAPESMVDFELILAEENSTTDVKRTESTDAAVVEEEVNTADNVETPEENTSTDIKDPQLGTSELAEDNALVYYTVKQGDTAFDIAQRLGISVEDIRVWNNMANYELNEGSRIVVGRKRSVEEREANKNTVAQSNEAILVGDFLIYTTQTQESLADIAEKFSVSAMQIKEWNEFPADFADPQTRLIVGKAVKPEIENANVEDKAEVLAYKTEKTSNDASGTVEAATSAPERVLPQTHRVGSSQTLYAVSKLYNLPVSSLMAWNNLAEPSVKEGQTIRLKAPEGFIENTTTPPTEGTHIVIEGETLYSISKKYSVSVANIRKWNGIQGQEIRVGQKILVQEPLGGSPNTTVAEQAKDPNFHVVEEGETLRSVAQKYSLELLQFANWNKMDTTYIVKIDEKLFVVDPSKVQNENKDNKTEPDKKDSDAQNNDKAGTLVFHLVRSDETIFKIAKTYGVTTDQIRAWNGLENDMVKSGTKLKVYALILPEGTKAADNTDANKLDVPKFVYFRAGGNLYKLCQKYKLNLSDVLLWNSFKPDQVVDVGDIVYLQESAAIEAGKYNPNEVKTDDGSESADGVPNFVYFRAGGNLYKLCQKYNLNLSDVMEWNGFVKDQVIDVGQIVYLKKEAAEAAKKGEVLGANSAAQVTEVPDFVYFREGGNLYKLCKKYGLNLSEVQDWNGFKPDQIMKVGQIVYLKKEAAENATATKKEETLGSSKKKEETTAAVLEVPDFVYFRAGGSLYNLCKKYNLNVSEVQDWNGFKPDQIVKVGDTVYLKKEAAEKAKAGKSSADAALEVPDFVYFRAGGSLYNLCKKYSLNVSEVQDWNGFKPDQIVKVGDIVYLKKEAAEKAKAGKSSADAALEVPDFVIFREGGNFYKLCKKYSLDAQSVMQWNGFEAGQVFNVGDIVYLKKEAAEEAKRKKNESSLEAPDFVYFRAGGSLYNLCKKYNLNVSEVQDWNGFKPDQIVKVGDIVYLKKEAAEKARKSSSATKATDGKTYHTVKEGETFYDIVEKYNLKPADLATWNKMPANKREVSKGMKLIVAGMPSSDTGTDSDPDKISPESNEKTESEPQKTGAKLTHVVQEGETLSSVARKYEVSTTDVMSWNKLETRILEEGQKLIILQ